MWGPRDQIVALCFRALSAFFSTRFASQALNHVKMRVPSGRERYKKIDKSAESRRKIPRSPFTLPFATTNVFAV